MSESKERLTYRPEPETRQKIEQWYEADNCRSMNVLVEPAIEFRKTMLEETKTKPQPSKAAAVWRGGAAE